MVYNRTGYAPWSLTREAGVQSATVDGTIEVPQYIQPVLDTGFVDEKGNWKGTISSDEQFIGLTVAESVANGGEVLFPDTATIASINMTGFNSIFIALKVSNGGGFAIEAVMGPDTTPFANLTPVNAASTLIGNAGTNDFETLFSDAAQAQTADVWNIFRINTRLADQKNMQFKITNNSGGASDIEFGFMRIV